MFADDFSVLLSCKNSKNLNEKMYQTITTIFNWMKDHSLEINFTKTKIMQFRPFQKTELDINFSFDRNKLECVPSFPLLGITIDSHINWKDHIGNIKTKLSQFIYALRQLKKTTNIQTALTAYYAFAHAWLSYGVILWGNSTLAQDLLILQKKCIRIITNIKQTDSCKPYFRDLKILTLPGMYILESCKFVKAHPEFYSTIGDLPRRYESRSKNNLLQATSNLALHKNGPYSMSIKIYNKLPDHIKNEPNNNKCVNTLKKFLVANAYYTVNEYLNRNN